MKPLFRTTITFVFAISIYLLGLTSYAQCGAGYTSASINWDMQYYNNSILPSSGINYMIGKNSMQHKWTGSNTFNGVVNTHTGEGSSFGTGNDLQYTVGNGADTLIFEKEVSNLKFSVYDIDNGQTLTVTATNAAGTAQNITIAKVSGTVLTITGNGTTSGIAANLLSASASNASSDGTANITIAGPVKKVTLTFTKLVGTDNIFISDISACIYGNWMTNYQAIATPEEGQDTLLLVSYSDSTIYVLDITTNIATPLFKDPYIKEPNSLAFDSYNQIVYYCDGLGFSPTNKSVIRYNLRTDIRDTLIADVTTLGIQIFTGGLASAGAAFYDGSLFLGQEPYALNEPNAVWKIDIDTLGNATKASRVWSKIGHNGSVVYNWADFVIRNGIIYNFNNAASAAANTNIEHIDLNSQTVTNGYTYAGISQSAMDFLGNIYSMKASNYALYNGAGNFGTAKNYTGVSSGAVIVDAAEAYKYPYDYGDAPTSYGTAFHLYKKVPKIKLGSLIDYATTAVINSYATADDLQNTGAVNDEDGVPTFPLIYSSFTSYAVNVNVTNTSGAPAYVAGFIDFNRDGDFNDGGETSTVITVPNGSTSVVVPWPSLSGNLSYGPTFARFRIAATAAEVQVPSGYAASGEVEDYPIIIAGSVLPIEYVFFTAKAQNNKSALLSWKTASEYNNDYFEIQRSKDAEHWESIGHVKGAGNTHTFSSYSFVDENAYKGFSYYRLMQVDFDKKYRYSLIATIKIDTTVVEKNGDISVYPNPTKDELWIKMENETKEVEMQIYNFAGQNMFNAKLNKNLQKLNISAYPVGMYIIIIDDKLFKIIKE